MKCLIGIVDEEIVDNKINENYNLEVLCENESLVIIKKLIKLYVSDYMLKKYEANDFVKNTGMIFNYYRIVFEIYDNDELLINDSSCSVDAVDYLQ